MKWSKVFTKAGLGFITFTVAFLSTHPEMINKLIPEDIATMTIGSAVTAFLVALANWLKHRKDNK